jgi:hypothetical protein
MEHMIKFTLLSFDLQSKFFKKKGYDLDAGVTESSVFFDMNAITKVKAEVIKAEDLYPKLKGRTPPPHLKGLKLGKFTVIRARVTEGECMAVVRESVEEVNALLETGMPMAA